jgi:hypothetical protein
LIQGYYLGSPIFFLVSLFWSFELRTTFLTDPIYRLADQATSGQAFMLPYSAGEVLLNGVFAGSFFLMGFYRAQSEVLRRYSAKR